MPVALLALALARAAAAEPGETGEDPRTPARLAEAVRAHQNAIEQRETSDGPWAEGLQERYDDLGHALWGVGAHHRSLQAWKHALHLKRMSGGLHTLEQVALARRIGENHLRLSDWESADHMEGYIWTLHRRDGSDPTRRFEAGIYRARWQLSYQNYSPHPGTYLNQALWLLDELEGADASRDLPQRRALLRAQASVHHHLAQIWQQALQGRQSLHGQFQPNGAAASSGRERPAPNRSAPQGRKHLRRLLESYPNDAAHWRDRTLAHLALADWEMAFISKQVASATYHEARAAASTHADRADFVRQQLSQPVPVVPAMPPLPRAHNAELLARFDVSAGGRVRHVSLLDYAPKDLSETRLRRYLSRLPFRPRFSGGQPVHTTGFKWRHTLDRQDLR